MGTNHRYPQALIQARGHVPGIPRRKSTLPLIGTLALDYRHLRRTNA